MALHLFEQLFYSLYLSTKFHLYKKTEHFGNHRLRCCESRPGLSSFVRFLEYMPCMDGDEAKLEVEGDAILGHHQGKPGTSLGTKACALRLLRQLGAPGPFVTEAKSPGH